jgi:uncharacterized protein (DUF1800 family)
LIVVNRQPIVLVNRFRELAFCKESRSGDCVVASRLACSRLALAGTVLGGLVAFAAAATQPMPADAANAMQHVPAVRTQVLGEAERARLVLDRLAFGARPGEVERVRAMGVDAWIARQLRPESIDDADVERRVAGLRVPKMSTAELFASYPNPNMLLRQAGVAKGKGEGEDREQLKRELVREAREKGYRRPREVYNELATDRLLRATYSERQLQEVMVDFWSNHFNVYAKKNVSQWYLPAFDRDTIRPHALGNFRELLLATARSPAMLFYLDNYQSVSPKADLAGRMRANPRRASKLPDGINENYARELMELHTLGVDGGYSQQDIKEVARAFTGWTIADARGIGAGDGGMARNNGNGRDAGRGGARLRQRFGVPAGVQSGEFYFNPLLHDGGAKTVLGRRIDSGGMGDGLAVIDLLARHPSTARFIAGKLCEKFVSDKPDPALVARVAAAFSRSNGDIRATLSALFRDPAFFAPANYRAKVKTPYELVVSSLRTLGAQSNGREVQLLLADLGQPLYGYQAPTGYSEAAADWVNSGALLKRMNFAVALAANRIPGTRVDLAPLGRAGDSRAALDAGIRDWLGGNVSAETRRGLLARLEQPLPEARLDAVEDDAMNAMGGDEIGGGGRGRTPRARLLAASGDPRQVQAAALILGSPEFQRQ